MAITKTFIEVDLDGTFTNPLVYEEIGQANSILADRLTSGTTYYTRSCVVKDGDLFYSDNVEQFTTLNYTGPNLFFINELNTGNPVELIKYGSPTNDITLDYSTDGGNTWTTWTSANGDLYVEVPAGGTIAFQGDNATFSTSYKDYFNFRLSDFKIAGNIMSLVDSTASSVSLAGMNNCFGKLFLNNSRITNGGLRLPATTLADNCYEELFYQCTNWDIAPELPAKAMTSGCYSFLFGATSISKLPELPATTLADGCYNAMFYSCPRIASIPANYLPVTTLATGCYQGMFSRCSNITSIPNNFLPATTLEKNCYTSMFQGCTSLTSIPTGLLPAMSMRYEAYRKMFMDCVNLVTIPSNLLPATTLAYGCYQELFKNCKNIVSGAELPATTTRNVPAVDGFNAAQYCYAEMYYGCESMVDAPEIMTIDMYNGVFNRLFYNCASLRSVKIHINNYNVWNSSSAQNWLYGTQYYGDFYNLGGNTGIPSGFNGIPTGWTEHRTL